MAELEKPTSEPSSSSSVDRRDFLKLAATGAATAATLVAAAQSVSAQESAAPVASKHSPTGVDVMSPNEKPGSDYMVDVLKSLDFEYVVSNPASTFRGIQESLINYGGNKKPEWLTCLHEESSVGMAVGYYVIEGKPLIMMAHPTAGLQHASSAIFNAYQERAPVFIILGHAPFDVMERRPGPDWSKSAVDTAAVVRDYTKWDDTPWSLGHFAESAVRAYKIAMTAPAGPVVLVVDGQLQERPVDGNTKVRIPKLALSRPSQADTGSTNELAKMLVNAEYPVIRIGDSLTRNPEGLRLIVELAELLQAPTDGGNFPNRHPLSGGDLGKADVVLGLATDSLFGNLHSIQDQLYRTMRNRIKPGTKVINIDTSDTFIKGNFQALGRYTELDMSLAADAQATLPSLIEACKKLITADRTRFFEDRGRKIGEANMAERERIRRDVVPHHWDLNPISHARIAYELWAQIKNKDWSLVANGDEEGWTSRVWDFTKHYQHTNFGPGGVADKAPMSVGAALANKKYGRLSINIQKDGDLMYANGVLWTAAHHKIPMLTLMHNNRSYHQEVMHLQRVACQRNRDAGTAHIGTEIDHPAIDYAKLAQSMGWYAEGPISDPKDLGPAIKRAIAVVERGEPALLDTVMQPR